MTLVTLGFDKLSKFHRLVIVQLLNLSLVRFSHELGNLLFSSWLTSKYSHTLLLLVFCVLLFLENFLLCYFLYVFFLSITLQLLQGGR